MYDVLRFWMDSGVAGFRIDAVSRLFEDPELHDDPIKPGNNVYGDPTSSTSTPTICPRYMRCCARCGMWWTPIPIIPC